MSRIRVPTPLRGYVAGQSEVEVTSASVAEALQELVERYPSLRPHLFGEAGELRPYINLFVNDRDVRSLHGEQTLLTDHDRLMILPSIAGGAVPRAVRGVDHNALEHPDLADSWVVLSLPTTLIIDSAGRPRRVSHGATRAPRLSDQLAGIGEHAPEGSRAADPANEALS